MPKKYSIHSVKTDPRFPPIGKYMTIEFREDCAGSCRACVKKRCVFNIFKDNFTHWSNMTEPEYLYTCKSCYRCVEECTKGIFSMAINPDYRTLGNSYWTAQIVNTTWAQAHTGAVPVSGAGYRGPFSGEGFDSIWTDMSEIVRPTRDGIHGREYISTMVELSRRPTRLTFNKDKTLATEITPIMEIPIPVALQEPSFGILSENQLLSMAAAANAVGTVMFIKPESYTEPFNKYADNLVPCLTKSQIARFPELIRMSRMIELAYETGIENEFARLRTLKPGLFISVALPLDAKATARALELAKTDVDTLHFYASENGRELGTDKPRHLKDMIREVHLKLVGERLRNKVNLMFSGGIALAEHMAKSIFCGADAVSIDIPLLLALECRLCDRCKEGKSCPVKIGEVDLKWASQRIVNMLCSWHNQLLEVMGACGLREARSMKGEIGRTMWYDDIERDSFGPIFGTRKVS